MYCKMTIYLKPEDVEDYKDSYITRLIDVGFDEQEAMSRAEFQLKNNVVLLYTKEWQDENLEYWIKTILEVPGGYWIVQDLIRQPHCEYEHYQWKNKMCYEKTNVSDQTAKRELSAKSYEIYQIAKRLKSKTVDCDLNVSYTVKP